MKNGFKSGMLLTNSTRYSQQLINFSNRPTKSRINLLAASGSSNLRLTPTLSSFNPESNSISNPNMHSKISKLSFECQLLLQDVRAEQYQLKKNKQYFGRVQQQVHCTTSETFTDLTLKLIELQGNLAKRVTLNNERTKRLLQQLERRKQSFQNVRGVMGYIGARIKRLEDALGCCTANDKIQDC